MKRRAFLTTGLAGAGLALAGCTTSTQSPEATRAASGPGPIVAHGGGDISSGRSSGPRLSAAFSQPFRLGGGRRARIVTIASREDDGDDWMINALAQDGYRNTHRLRRTDPNAVGEIMAADVIFFDGGVQTRLMRKLNAYPAIRQAVVTRHRQGAVVGGTSAGAAALSRTMICCDRGGQVIMSRGLGLLPDVVIDQHYSNRNRQFRLNQVISRNPGLVGLGLDEGEAAVFRGNSFTMSGGSGTLVRNVAGALDLKSVRSGTV